MIQQEFKFFGTVKIPFSLISKINRLSSINQEVLRELGFNNDGDVWIHYQEYYFSIKLESKNFYIGIWDNIEKQPFPANVGELAKQFEIKTGQKLYEITDK